MVISNDTLAIPCDDFVVTKIFKLPGYPLGGWVRISAAALEATLCTRTPNTAKSRATWLSLAEPAGVWFSIVHSWKVPSPRSSNDPVPEQRKKGINKGDVSHD